MLRAFVAALLVANLAFFAWSQGWLDAVVGARSIGDREPERLLRQVHPELVRVLSAGDAASAAAASPPPFACLEAGPFTDAEVAAAQASAQAALPGAALSDAKTEQAGTWMVYMGRYAGREAMTKKEDELKRRNLPYEEIREGAGLAPGLSLGRFDNPAAATRALDQFSQQGIRTARVVELAPAIGRYWLRIDAASPALAAQAAALPLASGKSFAACARAAGA